MGPSENECFRPIFMDPLGNCAPNTYLPSSTPLELWHKQRIDSLMNCITLEVYDRWGIKMFESTDEKKCWDGKAPNGSPAKEGTYYYIARLDETTISNKETTICGCFASYYIKKLKGPTLLKGYMELLRGQK
jgi:gliding motility-associated-like protein